MAKRSEAIKKRSEGRKEGSEATMQPYCNHAKRSNHATKTKKPKNRESIFENNNPPCEKKSIFRSGSITQNHHTAQYPLLSNKNITFVSNFKHFAK